METTTVNATVTDTGIVYEITLLALLNAFTPYIYMILGGLIAFIMMGIVFMFLPIWRRYVNGYKRIKTISGDTEFSTIIEEESEEEYSK